MLHFANTVILALVAVLMLYAAWTDLRRYVVGNGVIVALLVLFVAHIAIAEDRSSLPWTLALAGVMFAVLFFFFVRNWVGGADVKLMTMALLWVGIDRALPFAVLLLVFVLVHAVLARFKLVGSPAPAEDGRPRIAYAPSIAAAVIGTLLLVPPI
jgi:prepilin peptidase CpaA